MSHEKSTSLETKIHKRNGQVVAFNESRIKRAIGNAFKEQRHLPREVELSIEVSRNAEKVTNCVVAALKERFLKNEYVTVEEVQDEVIRQLFENGFKDVGELYANYRKQHTARRALFELYTITKRDGKVVSFKPEKITLAIARAFRAYNNGILTESLLEFSHKVSESVVKEIRTLWPDGKCIHIEEIQDLVETNLMKSGYHDIAKGFILYREKQAKTRREKLHQATEDVSYDLVKDIKYKTKDDEEKPIPLREIRFQLETCCQGLENVSSDVILKEAIKNYFNGMSEDQIVSIDYLCSTIDEKTVLIGDGLYLYKSTFVDRINGLVLFAPEHLCYGRASSCAILGIDNFKKAKRDEVNTLVPKYIRQADAELLGKR